MRNLAILALGVGIVIAGAGLVFAADQGISSAGSVAVAGVTGGNIWAACGDHSCTNCPEGADCWNRDGTCNRGNHGDCGGGGCHGGGGHGHGGCCGHGR